MNIFRLRGEASRRVSTRHADGVRHILRRQSSAEWWERRRLRYNIGLIFAGLLAFACYVAVVEWGVSIGAIQGGGEITLFTTIFQGIGYLFMMLVANAFYGLGPYGERKMKPADIDQYRRIAFRLGFWFSMLLPFSIPVLLVCLCLIRPTWWQG
jgi:hypothetical protein